MMDGPPWTPRGSNSTTASARLPPASHGSKKGGLAPGVASAAGSAATGLDGHGCFMARPTGRISLGPSGGPHPQQPGAGRGVDRAAAPRGTPGRHDAISSRGRHAGTSAGTLPEGHPELLARPLYLLYGA